MSGGDDVLPPLPPSSGARIAGITVLRWVRHAAGLESPRQQARTAGTWERGTALVREWSNDPLTANDFYDRAIIVRLRWVNGLLLPEYAWSLLEAAAITDLGATIYNHARRNYANNRLRSPRAAMGRQVLLRCSFRDGGIDVIEMAARALEAYCPEEEAAVWIARLRELAGENQ